MIDTPDVSTPRARSSITIAGVSHELRLGFRALKQIEQDCRGVLGWMNMLDNQAQRFDAIQIGIVAGLLHEKPKDWDVEKFRESVLDRLDPADLSHYSDALMQLVGEFAERLKRVG